MKRNLIVFYKSVVLPILFIFSLLLLGFTTLIFVIAKLNPQQTPITSASVNNMILYSVILTSVFSVMFVLVLVVVYLLSWAPLFGKKLARRMSSETAYNLESVLGFTIVPIAMITFTFLILLYLVSDFLYFLVTLAFLFAFMVIASIWEGILDSKEKASFLLRKFSEDIKASIEKTKSSLPNARKFVKGLKTFDETLPTASHIPSMDRRINQVELILSLGDKKDLSTLSDSILAVTESMESEHLEGFDEKYRNLTEFLDAFENEKKGVVELTERISLKEKIKKQSGEMLKDILVKTSPFLITILISVLIWLWLGIRPELPT